MITTHHIKEFPVTGADIHLYCGRETSYKARTGLVNAKLGNPHPVGWCRVCGVSHTRDEAVMAYRAGVSDSHKAIIDRIRLRNEEGKDLALYCFCKPQSCHCDAIKAIAEA
jgi:hypothetical protein